MGCPGNVGEADTGMAPGHKGRSFAAAAFPTPPQGFYHWQGGRKQGKRENRGRNLPGLDLSSSACPLGMAMAGTHPMAGTHRGTAGSGRCPDLPARRVGSGNAAGSAAAGIPRQGCAVWAGSQREKLAQGQRPPGPGLGGPQDKEPPAPSIPRAAGMRRAPTLAAKWPDSSQGAPPRSPFPSPFGLCQRLGVSVHPCGQLQLAPPATIPKPTPR